MYQNPYAIAADLILAAIAAGTFFRACKRGFVNIAAGLIAVIGAVLVTREFGSVLTEPLLEHVFDPLVTDAVTAAVGDAMRGAAETAEAAAQAVTDALARLSDYSAHLGFAEAADPTAILAAASDGIDSSSAQVLTEQVAAPIAGQLALWASHLLIFAAAYLALTLILRAVDVVARLPLLKQANCLLGAVCGAVMGICYAWIAAHLLSLLNGVLVTNGTLPADALTGFLYTLLMGRGAL